MRTTLSIDDDVLDAVKARARHEGRTTGEVLSDLARQALVASARRVAVTDATRNGIPLLAPAGRPVSNDVVERLRDEEGV